jgi:hypothetical protein
MSVISCECERSGTILYQANGAAVGGVRDSRVEGEIRTSGVDAEGGIGGETSGNSIRGSKVGNERGDLVIS